MLAAGPLPNSGSSEDEDTILFTGFFLPESPFLRSDFVVSAEMNTIIPITCSMVHSLSKNKNERNRVVAFRAVDVILMVSAPKFFVMAAEHELPKNPMVENKIMVATLPPTDQVRSSRGTLFCCSARVPGCNIHTIPSAKSPFANAAALIAIRAIEYMRKMNSSWPTPYSFIIFSLMLVIAPSHIKETVWERGQEYIKKLCEP